jgi:type II secretory pathway component PulM
MTYFRQIFGNLNSRERQVLALGFVIFVLILVYTLAWAPWHDTLRRLRIQVPDKQATLSWMQEQSKQVKPLLKLDNSKPENDVPLLTVVETTAASAKMRTMIRRMSPGDQEGQVKVWLTEASFDTWLLWLEELRKQSVEVVSSTISRGEGGKVTIRMTLQRSV